jgi:hypothetical protein
MLEELERLNPSNTAGQRHHRHHQHLTTDIGHPALQQLIFTAMSFMRVNNTWPPFVRMMDRAFPKIGDTYALALDDDALNAPGLDSEEDVSPPPSQESF